MTWAERRSRASVWDEGVVEVVADVFTGAAVAVSVNGGALLFRPTMLFERTMWEAWVVVNSLKFTLGDEVVVEVVVAVFTDAAVAVSVDGGARLSRPTMSFERTMWEAGVVVNCLNFTLCYLL